ncbi:alkaline phosphatase [Flavobacterium saliperosum S13]|nr:alkaline phosphatase [Flavobacterium saliperosum S13]
MFYNIVSSFLWSYVLIFAGHYLYTYLKNNYGINLKEYIELIIIGIIVLSTAPLVINSIKNKMKARK